MNLRNILPVLGFEPPHGESQYSVTEHEPRVLYQLSQKATILTLSVLLVPTIYPVIFYVAEDLFRLVNLSQYPRLRVHGLT